LVVVVVVVAHAVAQMVGRDIALQAGRSRVRFPMV